MNVLQTFEKNGKEIQVYGTYDEPLFQAKPIGKMLGLTNIRANLLQVKDNWKVVKRIDTPGGMQKATFVKEPGLYKLIMRSDKKEAVEFQDWICCDVLPSIRKTGRYELNHKPFKMLTFKIQTECDLHKKVVNFIRNSFPKALISASLGELQTDSKKRVMSYTHGYQKGTPDLTIHNLHKHYTGFVIELKTPKGTGELSEHQTAMLEEYKNNGYKVLVSNDYDEIVIELYNYFQGVRVKCKYCDRKFKSTKTMKKHHKYFHKIDLKNN